ncbi:MAG: DUF3224 domain-containing protein [Candidatus Thorarchaeota archaeon]
MKRKLATGILVFVLSCILLTSVTAVSAAKPIEMTVICTPLVVELDFEELPSGIMKVTFWTNQTWTGDWEGIAEQGGTGMIRPADHGKASIILDCFGEFTGTIQGKTGTVVYYMRNNINPEGEYFSAIMTIIRGTGELANIHGHGVVVDDITTRIWVHFDPS